jgi:hypothetical protein
MLVMRFGPEVRRWIAVGAAGAVVVGLLRWGLHHSPALPPLAAASGTQAAAAGSASLQESVVALTVDAPDGIRIEALTQALTRAALPATIFVASGYAAAHPAALRLFVQEGDEVEVLAGPSGGTVATTAHLVQAATGETPLYARLAAGNPGQGLLRSAQQQGLGIVGGGRETLTELQFQNALAPGAVLTLPPTAAPEIPALAAYLQSHGYQAVTLEALRAIDAGAASTSLPSLP